MRSTSESLVRFRWRRPDAPYRWRRDYEPMWPEATRIPKPFHDDPNGPWLIGSDQGRLYEPLRRRRDLHIEFSRLPLGGNDESLAELAAFATRYGRLGVEGLPVKAISLTQDDEIHWAEHHATWRRAISRIGGLVELVDAYQSTDMERLSRYVRWRSGSDSIGLHFAWPGSERATWTEILRDVPTASPGELAQLERWQQLAQRYDSDRFVAPLEYYLYREVNKLLGERVAPFLPHGGGVQLKPDSLLGASTYCSPNSSPASGA